MRQIVLGLDAFTIKCTMAVLMLLDHLHLYIPGMPEWFTWAGRLVAPMFCYLMTQAMVYTTNRTIYIKRLLIASGIMFLGNTLLSTVFHQVLRQNIFFSLALSAVMIQCIDNLIEKKMLVENMLLGLFLAYLTGYAEGGIVLPVMALVFYYLRNHRLWMCLAYVLAMVGLVLVLWQNVFPQVFMVSAVIPIWLYNGQKGRGGKWEKRFFYVFYPAHIWVLFSLSKLFFE